MINSGKEEKYDKAHRIVLFETNKDGKCVPKVTSPEIATELVPALYKTRSEVWKSLKEELISGKISPIKLYFDYHNMSSKDLASRVRLSESAVKKHFTMKGFMKLNIEILQRYAIVFDISVADFFNFFDIKGKISITTKTYNRIMQDINISLK